MGIWVVCYSCPYEDDDRDLRCVAPRSAGIRSRASRNAAVSRRGRPAVDAGRASTGGDLHAPRRQRGRRWSSARVPGCVVGRHSRRCLWKSRMIAVDTNLLVYAHRKDSPFHEAAAARVRELAESPAQWAIPWPCLHEFYSIATHPRIYSPPSTADQVIDQIEAWLGSPTLILLAES